MAKVASIAMTGNTKSLLQISSEMEKRRAESRLSRIEGSSTRLLLAGLDMPVGDMSSPATLLILPESDPVSDQ